MTENSFLCHFILAHPEDWDRRLMKDYSLRVKKDGDYAIFNYNIVADFYDPIVQEARGIIIDTARLRVVCWPFRKFGNHSEGYADPIDWASARVLEKVDGSIIKLWFDDKKGDWQFSTNGTIRAECAGVEGAPLLTYGGLVAEAENYGDIPFDALDRTLTYIFELVSPKARVVIPYEKTLLYHTGTRSNLTGEELEVDIGIRKPASYPIGSLEDCLTAAAALNRNNGSDEVTYEGFVVVDKDYHRVKIKSMDYITVHHVFMLRAVGKQACIELLLENPEKLKSACERNPGLDVSVKYYEYKLAELLYRADQMSALALRLYEEYSHDRRAVAAAISRHPLAFVGFAAIDKKKSGREILMGMPVVRWVTHIPDYEPEDIVSSIGGASTEE